MKNVGVIGLGLMGDPMSRNLLKAGYDVAVYNRSPAKAAPLKELGATVCKSIAEVSARSEAIVVMVSNDAAVKEVVLGSGGIVGAAKPGTYVIDSSTVHPRTARDCSAALKAKGVHHLDAPVTGSRKQAEEGILAFLVGGTRDAYEACAPLFDTMGKRRFHLGPSGAGASAKLCNNLMGAIHIAALSEGMSLAAKCGLDPKQFFEVISQSGSRSAMVDVKGPKILSGDFTPAFALTLMHKDVRLADDLAHEVKHSLPVLEAVRGVFRAAEEKLPADKDFSALYEWYSKR
jgi:3-hydroxyisobutyrate dehydrogenase-like beta-hydroxyacid dehydrogenase